MHAPNLERQVPADANLERRRNRWNFQLLGLTVLNLLILAMWAGLSASHDAHPLVVLCLTALTAATWAALFLTLLRRIGMCRRDEKP